MSWYSFRPYVSAAERRRKAEATAKKLAKKGRVLAPVQLEGRKIAGTFWGKSWCDNLESYSDFANRLPRGRTYARNGSVIDLQIAQGKIEALVHGSDLYKISITIASLGVKRWQEFRQACAGKITHLLDLLQGRLSKEILADITTRGSGLFPAPKEIVFHCSCPDSAGMCKHIAAVLYGIGARLDTDPELFFTLRGVDMQELMTAASANAVTSAAGEAGGAALAGEDLSAIFGVEIEGATESVVEAPSVAGSETAPAGRGKSSRKKTGAASRKSARKLPDAPVTAGSEKRVLRRAAKPRSASAAQADG
jgi:uncharacterized Zn finger protein